ncbi:hypothetical protein [Ktedonobacter sp. SOSP1-52]|nr:hypothetical protein [Ktedonobacter sp. SOSP1-52]
MSSKLLDDALALFLKHEILDIRMRLSRGACRGIAHFYGHGLDLLRVPFA